MKALLSLILATSPVWAVGAEIYKVFIDVGINEVKEDGPRPKLAKSIGQWGDTELELVKVEKEGDDADKGLGLPPPFGAKTEYAAAFNRTTRELKIPVKFQIRKFVEGDARIFRYELISSIDGVVVSNVGARKLDGMMNVQVWGAPIEVDGKKYEPTMQVLFQPDLPARP